MMRKKQRAALQSRPLFFCFRSKHLQQFNLLTGGAGEKPVLQAAEGVREHPFLRRHE